MTRSGSNSFFAPWLGKEEYALTALSLVSVWQFVGIPMMLIYAALLSIPEEILEAGEIDGITGISAFWKIKLPLILPSIGIISILTFVGNFNAFDLIYTAQGALAGPDFATDILGTFMYRTFFGFQLQLGDPQYGFGDCQPPCSAIILVGVSASTCSASRRGCGGTSCEDRTMNRARSQSDQHFRRARDGALMAFTRLIALFPVFVIIINSFKSRKAIFREPLSPAQRSRAFR